MNHSGFITAEELERRMRDFWDRNTELEHGLCGCVNCVEDRVRERAQLQAIARQTQQPVPPASGWDAPVLPAPERLLPMREAEFVEGRPLLRAGVKYHSPTLSESGQRDRWRARLEGTWECAVVFTVGQKSFGVGYNRGEPVADVLTDAAYIVKQETKS